MHRLTSCLTQVLRDQLSSAFGEHSTIAALSPASGLHFHHISPASDAAIL